MAPPVSAAAVAPGEVSCPPMPTATPVVLLAVGFGVAVESVLLVLVLDFDDFEVDVVAGLDAKPGDELVHTHPCLIRKSGYKKNAPIRVSSISKTAYTFFKYTAPRNHAPVTTSRPKILLVQTPLLEGSDSQSFAEIF